MTIKTFQLNNGMQVLIEENHASKVVSFNALVKAGSADEKDNEAGICHVIEHMLFKGTPTRPMGTIARDVEAAGGEINAYTSIDQTVYYINMATQFADRGLEILADAIKNPLFDEEELTREKEVILEEIRREHDNPSRMLSEHLFNTAFQTHTYGRPIIGFPKTVNSFTRAQILAFYRKWYTPKNIVFIAVGDFETGAMLKAIEKRFADFKGPELPKSSATPEPQQSRPRMLVKKMNIQSAYMALGFHIPHVTHPDVPALDLLAHIMGGADSSRLEQEIKEKQRLVHNIYAYSFTPKHPGIFVIGAMLNESNIEKTIRAICREIDRMKTTPVTSEELSNAKLNIRSSEIYEKETVGGQGSKIAYFHATAGSHEFEARYYQMLADVGTSAVMDVATRYLDPNRCTAILLVPDNVNQEKIRATAEKAIAPAKKMKTLPRPETTKPERVRLSNGVTLIVQENHNLPIVSVCGSMLGGTRFETAKTNGVSGLLARLFTKGTTSRSAIDIAKEIESLAGQIDGFSGRNTIGVRCEFLSERLHDGFELFADVLMNPDFASAEVSKEKKLLIQAIRDQEDALTSVVFSSFLRALFPKHPYGLRLMGEIDSVRALERKDLLRYHNNVVRAKNLVIGIVGDINPGEIKDLAEKYFSSLPKGAGASPRLKADPRPKQVRSVVLKKREKQQAHIVIGFQGTTCKSKDRFAMAVLNNILSGQGGRLFINLRDRMGLAYSVNSVNQEGLEPGYFAVYIGTDPAKKEKAIAGILGELKLICSEPISNEELTRSKQYLVGTYELDLQRNGTRSGIYSFNEVYGMPLKDIEDYPARIIAVTAKDVLEAAKRYINVDAYTMAVVEPE